jgi:riboflavin biosynthesis pyrimidine reductase
MSARIDSLWPTAGTDLGDDELTAGFVREGDEHPWLRVNFVSSVDGAATHDGRSAGLSGEADKRLFDLMRRPADVILVGAGTVRTEGYGPMRVPAASVDWRIEARLAPQPVFAIVSAALVLDPASRVFTEAPVRPIVVTVGSSPAGKRAALSKVADVVVCGDHELDPIAMLAVFADRGFRQVHSEGGPSLFGSLLEADVVDELCLTLSPQLEGGDADRIVAGIGPQTRSLRLAGILRSDDTLLLRYRRER